MKRMILKEDLEVHKETIEKIKELCYEHSITRYYGYKNPKFIQEAKPYIVNLCVARSIINEKEYAFTYRYISERIIGWYVCHFQSNFINLFNIRKLFNQSSRLKMTELQYKNILIKEIMGYKLSSEDQKDYINNIDHLIILMWSLRDMYSNKYLVTTEEILRVSGLSKITINKILRRFNMNIKRKGIK